MSQPVVFRSREGVFVSMGCLAQKLRCLEGVRDLSTYFVLGCCLEVDSGRASARLRGVGMSDYGRAKVRLNLACRSN